jgi:chromosome segregation ATPase
MDSPKFFKSDPAVLLLNEIDILLAQMRLIELYLKQSRATAAHETSRIQVELQNAKSETAILRDRIAELETAHQQAQAVEQEFAINRQNLQVELTALRHQLEIKQQDFEKQQLISRTLHEGLEDQLAKLIKERRSESQEVATELQQARVEVVALHAQVAELQAGRHEAQAIAAQELEQTRVRFESEIAGLQIVLAARDRALRENETTIADIEHSFKTDILTLRSQLEQKQELIEFRDDELRDSQGQLAALQQRIIELESADRSAIASAEEIERIRRSFADELTALQREVATREELAITERQEAVTAVELALHSKIQALQQEQARSLGVIDERENELHSAHAEAAALRERISQLEAATAADLTTQQIAEKTRRSLEAELTSLHASLAQKEYALKEQQNFLRSVEDRLGGEINQLRGDLTQQRAAGEFSNAELERLRSEIATLQEQTGQSDLSRRQLEENWQRAVASERELRASLRGKDDELSAIQTNIDELKGQYDATISQLTEKGLLAESRVAEIGNFKADINRLSEQLAQRESAQTEAQINFQKELESSRAAHQAEMTAIYEEHRGLQHSLENELAQERQNAAGLRHQIAERERLVNEAQTALKVRERDFETGATETATLRARLHELEIASQAEKAADKTESVQALNRLETVLTSLRSDLQQKAWALAQQQATVESLALAHKSQIQKLEAKLAEQQNGIKDRNLDLEKAQSQSRALHKRIEELEAQLQNAQLAAVTRVEQMTQDHAARIEDLNSQLALKTGVLQERDLAESNIEQTLRNDLERLICEAEERNQILQNRNDELVRVKADVDSLQERFTQLETSTSQTESALAGKAERMHMEFQARLALLQAELSQKEWALEERDATARGLEQTYHQEIESLRKQLAEKEAANKPDGLDYVLGEPRLSQAGEKRFQVTDSTQPGDQHSHQATQSRRWNTGFAWKRRWKS